MMFDNRTSKKGNVSIILLVVAALVMVVITLMNFISFKGEFDDESREMSEVIGEVEFNYNYVFKIAEVSAREAIELNRINGGDLKETFKGIIEKRDLRIEGMGNFFGWIRNDKFKFEKYEDKYIFEVGELFVESWRGLNEENKIKRNFEIKIEFDDNGRILKKGA